MKCFANARHISNTLRLIRRHHIDHHFVILWIPYCMCCAVSMYNARIITFSLFLSLAQATADLACGPIFYVFPFSWPRSSCHSCCFCWWLQLRVSVISARKWDFMTRRTFLILLYWHSIHPNHAQGNRAHTFTCNFMYSSMCTYKNVRCMLPTFIFR